MPKGVFFNSFFSLLQFIKCLLGTGNTTESCILCPHRTKEAEEVRQLHQTMISTLWWEICYFLKRATEAPVSWSGKGFLKEEILELLIFFRGWRVSHCCELERVFPGSSLVAWKKVKEIVHCSVTSNFCDPPMDYSLPGSLSMGFSRQEHWNGLPFPAPGDLPDPGIEPRSPALQADSLPFESPGNSD